MSTPNLKQFFEQPYKREKWIDVLYTSIGNISFLAKPPVVKIKTNKYNATAVELGSFKTDEGYVIGLYEVSVPQRAKLPRNKRTLRDLLSLEYKNTVDAALVAFYQEHSGKWRFSYVSELKTHATDPKRFTYLLGEGEKCKTLADHFATIRKKYADKKTPLPITVLNEVFNVGAMSEEFFEEYRKLYGRFTAYLTGEDENSKKVGRAINGFSTFFPGVPEQAKKDTRDFVKKMMGRIVFLYFLQKKGWLGVPKDAPWGAGDPEFMSKLFKDCRESDIFYNQVLVPLFYDTLNNPERKDELFKIKPSVFKSGNYHQLKIPYLNGGLFDDDQPKTDLLPFKKELFQDLFSFFDSYNFTVEEGSDREHTVAVDPEMLGHIFENLLEDNKDKGAFYTPKEIVHYMCRESLVEYLHTALTDKHGIQEEGLRQKLDAFIRNDKAAEVGDYVEELAQALYDIKICDPAIGSGAFPMGLLKEIVEAVSALASEDQPTVRRIWKYKGEFAENLARIKAQIIENSIYGVDIEKGAVDIARLRFWLSLVVDEESPKPLPNLDYKIVVGNSLVSKLGDDIIDIDWNLNETSHGLFGADLAKRKGELLKKISSEQKDYFNPDSDKAKLAAEIRELKIDLLINQLELMVATKGIETKPNGIGKKLTEQTELYLQTLSWKDRIKQLKKLKGQPDKLLSYFDWKLDFPEVLNKNINQRAGFDVIIANPPYLKERDNAHIFNPVNNSRMGKLYHQGKMDYWYYFLHLALDISSAKSVISFITSRYWINSQGAKKLIDRVKDNLFFVSVVDIGKLKVFDNVAGHHMIHTYSKASREKFIYKRISNNIKVIIEENENDNLRIDLLSNKEVFSGSEIIFASQELKSSFTNTIGQKYDLSQGVVEAADKVSSKQFKKVGRSDVNIGDGVFVLEKLELKALNLSSDEKKLLVNYLDPNDVESYFINPAKPKYLIYSDNEARKLIEKQKSYSNLKSHLKHYKDFITSSNGPYGLHRPREVKYFTRRKILFKGMFVKNEFAIDDNKYFVGMSFISIIENVSNKGFSLDFLLGILNSKYALNWFYTYGKKRGAGVDIGVEKLRTFPLPLNPCTKIENLVKRIIVLKGNAKSTKNLENELDSLVYRLYELSYDEVKVIDPEFTLSKEEYKAIEIF